VVLVLRMSSSNQAQMKPKSCRPVRHYLLDRPLVHGVRLVIGDSGLHRCESASRHAAHVIVLPTDLSRPTTLPLLRSSGRHRRGPLLSTRTKLFIYPSTRTPL
jgi:hypothetical protein